MTTYATRQSDALARAAARLAAFAPPPPPTDRAIVRAMAVELARLARDHDRAEEADLRRAGFTAAEISTHGEAAGALARRLAEAAESGVRAMRRPRHPPSPLPLDCWRLP